MRGLPKLTDVGSDAFYVTNKGELVNKFNLTKKNLGCQNVPKINNAQI